MDYVGQFLKDLCDDEVRISQEYDNWNPRFYGPSWGFRHKGIDLAPKSKGNPKVKFLTYGEIKQGYEAKGYGNFYEVFDGEYYWVYGHFKNRLFNNPEAEAQIAMGEMGSSGLSTGTHLHIGCYKKKLGIKIYYNPLIIYTYYMEKLIELEKALTKLNDKVNNAVNPICVMEDSTVRIKSDKNKTYHVMKKDEAGKEALTSCWKLKGREKYKASEFDGYTEIK